MILSLDLRQTKELIRKFPKTLVFISLMSMFKGSEITSSALPAFIYNLKRKACKVIFYCQTSMQNGIKSFKRLSRAFVSPTAYLKSNRIFSSTDTRKLDLISAFNTLSKKFTNFNGVLTVIDEHEVFLNSLKNKEFQCKKILLLTRFLPLDGTLIF